MLLLDVCGVHLSNQFTIFQVYKLMGPILVKQPLEDSKQNVNKRIDYIGKELQKCQDQLTALENQQDKHRENLQKLQQALQMVVAMK